MSGKELERGGVLARVKAGELRVKDAAVIMKTSYRQAKRMWARYRLDGAAALKHGNAGKASNRARPNKERKKILGIVRGKYAGFGPKTSRDFFIEVHQVRLLLTLMVLGLESFFVESARQGFENRVSGLNR